MERKFISVDEHVKIVNEEIQKIEEKKKVEYTELISKMEDDMRELNKKLE